MKRRYFTLLEVVLATMVIFIGMGSIWGFFSYHSGQKKKTFLEIKIDRDLRKTIADYEMRLMRKESFFSHGEEKVSFPEEEITLHGIKVKKQVLLFQKKTEDEKEALLEFQITYKHPSLDKKKREGVYKRYVTFNVS